MECFTKKCGVASCRFDWWEVDMNERAAEVLTFVCLSVCHSKSSHKELEGVRELSRTVGPYE
jgi:hypothetical protein